MVNYYYIIYAYDVKHDHVKSRCGNERIFVLNYTTYKTRCTLLCVPKPPLYLRIIIYCTYRRVYGSCSSKHKYYNVKLYIIHYTFDETYCNDRSSSYWIITLIILHFICIFYPFKKPFVEWHYTYLEENIVHNIIT